MKKTGYIALLAAAFMSVACAKEETKEDFFNIDEAEVVLADHSAGTKDILLATNTEPTASVSGSAEWLTAEITPRCLTLTYGENTAEDDRTAEINIVAGSLLATVTVTQPGNKPEPEPEPEPEPDPLYKVYDVWYQNGAAAGIVFWVAEDGQSALVVSLDRTATTVAWSTDGSHVIGTGEYDGAANTALMRASEEAAAIPALAFCDAHGEGWFWPAMDEMKKLFEAYNGTTFDAATVAAPASITQEEKDARAAFDKALTDNGGTAINTASENSTGDQYWTSTEQTDEKTGKVYASTMRFGKVYASTPADQMGKTNASKRYVRCMKLVSGEPEKPLQTKFPVYKENGKNVGIIYWTSEDGKTSKVLSLNRSEDVPWSNAATPAFLDAVSADDGAANTATIKASAEAAEIPAIAFCSSLGEEWYWPSLNELVEIFNVYNGVAYDPTAKSKLPSEISDEEKAARAAFDLSLTTYGGVVMNAAAETKTGERYWASTELVDEAAGKAYGSFMRFGKAYMSSLADTPGKGKSGDGRFVRCIRVINNK